MGRILNKIKHEKRLDKIANILLKSGLVEIWNGTMYADVVIREDNFEFIVPKRYFKLKEEKQKQ